MLKILFKFFIILILLVITINISPIISYGDSDSAGQADGNDDWVGQADNFLEKAEKSIGLNKEKLNDASSDVYNIFTSVGMILSVIVGIALGIIYMMSSAIDKAKVKETLIPYLIGSFIIFGAFGVWKIAINTLGGL